jgi:hypothetical protein
MLLESIQKIGISYKELDYLFLNPKSLFKACKSIAEDLEERIESLEYLCCCYALQRSSFDLSKERYIVQRKRV